MSSGTLAVPELHVEGKDDEHTIIHLLRHHGVSMDEGVRPFVIVPSSTVDQLLEKMPEAIKAATSRPVGFVLDIDIPLVDRWASVRNRLLEANVDAPTVCPPQGSIGSRKGYTSKLGVWLMPDCSMDHGKLEDFVRTLIPSSDTLWPHAEASTALASQLGAEFSNPDRIKACVHCWLAWQKEPGRPFGTAIKAEFFGHDSPAAIAFLRWLGRLYGIEHLTQV